MTTVVVLQPGYIPWLGFFDQMRRADHFVYYDDVQFDKHGWRNRNRVKGPAGPTWMTVPVRHTGRADQLVLHTEIVEGTNWEKKQIRTLEQFYARAPHREPYAAEFAATIGRHWKMLAELDIAVIDVMRRWLGIATPTYRSSELGIDGDKSGRLVNLCRHFGANRYLSGEAARSYLDVAQFDRAGIDVAWQSYAHPTYSQLHGEFVSHLSALDLILNVGEDSRRILTSAGAGTSESEG
jgi:hypothetical protein